MKQIKPLMFIIIFNDEQTSLIGYFWRLMVQFDILKIDKQMQRGIDDAFLV